MKSKKMSIFYEVILLIIGIFGILIQLGVFEGQFNVTTLAYYTLISNIICIVYIALKLYNTIVKKKDDFLPRFKGGVVICITLTMFVVYFILSKEFAMGTQMAPIYSLSEKILHYIVPIMIIFDYLLFDKKGKFQAIDPVYWLIIPITYFGFTLINGALKLITFMTDSYYPYPFINVDQLGLLTVLRNAAVLIIIFLIIGYLLFGLDHLLGKNKTKKKRKKKTA